MYKEYFGLNDKPFKLTPDPSYFYASPHHERALSYLQYGLTQGEGFIVITGPIGTGKTTVARNLISTLSNSIVAAQISSTKLTPAELIHLVAAEFGLNPPENANKAELLKKIHNYFLSLNKQGKRALLVVDEAQNLSAETLEELRMLSNFQLNDKPLIQSFLLGQEELKPIIELPEMEQFRQRIIASSHLKALTEEDVKGYILCRLEQAGWNKKVQLKDDVFGEITRLCSGTPRKINIFLDRLFLFAFLEQLTSIDLAAVKSVAEEMKSELSGSLQKKHYKVASIADQKNNTLIQTEQKVKQILDETSQVLESVIQRKNQIIKELDRMIAEKKAILKS